MSKSSSSSQASLESMISSAAKRKKMLDIPRRAQPQSHHGDAWERDVQYVTEYLSVASVLRDGLITRAMEQTFQEPVPTRVGPTPKATS